MSCDSCKSDRTMLLSAKASDMFSWSYAGRDGNGYAPGIENVCRGDYLEMSFCLDCGKIQGKFPVVSEDLEFDAKAEAFKIFWEAYAGCQGDFYYIGEIEPAWMTTESGFRIFHSDQELTQIGSSHPFLIRRHGEERNEYVFVRAKSIRNNKVIYRDSKFIPGDHHWKLQIFNLNLAGE